MVAPLGMPGVVDGYLWTVTKVNRGLQLLYCCEGIVPSQVVIVDMLTRTTASS
jgi:hypothetical protein